MSDQHVADTVDKQVDSFEEALIHELLLADLTVGLHRDGEKGMVEIDGEWKEFLKAAFGAAASLKGPSDNYGDGRAKAIRDFEGSASPPFSDTGKMGSETNSESLKSLANTEAMQGDVLKEIAFDLYQDLNEKLESGAEFDLLRVIEGFIFKAFSARPSTDKTSILQTKLRTLRSYSCRCLDEGQGVSRGPVQCASCDDFDDFESMLDARDEEVERLKAELDILKSGIYCPVCGSCGEDGCCNAEHCSYPGIKAETVKEAKESADRAWEKVEKLEADNKRLESEVIRLQDMYGKSHADRSRLRAALKEIDAVTFDTFSTTAPEARAIAAVGAVRKILERLALKARGLE